MSGGARTGPDLTSPHILFALYESHYRLFSFNVTECILRLLRINKWLKSEVFVCELLALSPRLLLLLTTTDYHIHSLAFVNDSYQRVSLWHLAVIQLKPLHLTLGLKHLW